MKNELKHTNEHMVQGIPPLTLCPGASSHMRTREHRNHRLFPAVPSAREPPALPDCAGCARSAWTAQPTLNGRSGRAARASSLKEAGPKVRAATHAWGRSVQGAEPALRRGHEREGGKRRNGATGSTLHLFPSRGRRADRQGTAAILGFPDEPEAGRLSPAIQAAPRPAGPRFPD